MKTALLSVSLFFIFSGILLCLLPQYPLCAQRNNQQIIAYQHSFTISDIPLSSTVFATNNNILYFTSSDGVLYGYNYTKQKYTMNVKLGHFVLTGPVYINNLLYQCIDDTTLLTVSLNGTVLATNTLTDTVVSMAGSKNRLYFLYQSGLCEIRTYKDMHIVRSLFFPDVRPMMYYSRSGLPVITAYDGRVYILPPPGKEKNHNPVLHQMSQPIQWTSSIRPFILASSNRYYIPDWNSINTLPKSALSTEELNNTAIITHGNKKIGTLCISKFGTYAHIHGQFYSADTTRLIIIDTINGISCYTKNKSKYNTTISATEHTPHQLYQNITLATNITTEPLPYITLICEDKRLSYYTLTLSNHPTTSAIQKNVFSIRLIGQDNLKDIFRDLDNDGISELLVHVEIGLIQAAELKYRVFWTDVYAWDSRLQTYKWSSIQYPDFYKSDYIPYMKTLLTSPPFVKQTHNDYYKKYTAIGIDMAKNVITIARQIHQAKTTKYKNHTRYRKELAQWYYTWGLYAMKKRWDNHALFCFQQALSIEPNNYRITYQIGEIYKSYGLWKYALDAYAPNGLSADPYRLYFCQLFFDKLMIDKEITVIERPSRLRYEMQYAEMLMQNAQYTEAERSYTAILKKYTTSLAQPDNTYFKGYIYFNLAQLHQMNPNEYAQALYEWEEYKRITGKTYDVYHQRQIDSYIDLLRISQKDNKNNN